MTLSNTAGAILIFVPSVTWQMVGNVVATILYSIQSTYFYRWFALYAPPDMFGNFMGVVCTGCGALSLLIQSGLQRVSSSIFSGLNAFLVPLAVLYLCNVLSLLFFCCHVVRNGLSTCPPSIDDEQGRYCPVPKEDGDVDPNHCASKAEVNPMSPG